MDSGLWTVIGAALGFLGAIVPQWLNARGSRRLKGAELQEQTIKDLQDVLAGLRPPLLPPGMAKRSSSERRG